MVLENFIATFRARPRAELAQSWMERAASRNGFEREQAVNALEQLRHGPAIAVFLVRANDWVPQVRSAAVRALRTMVADEFMTDWLDALASIVTLDRARRADHRELLEAIASYLCEKDRLTAVAKTARLASAEIKRYVFFLQWRSAQDDAARFQLLKQALVSDDLTMARQALVRWQDVAIPEQRRALAEAACGSWFGSIRAEGLRKLLADPAGIPASAILPWCLDSNGAVREIAWNAIKTSGASRSAIAQGALQLGRSDVPAHAKVTALQFLCVANPQGALLHCGVAKFSSSSALRRVAFGALVRNATGVEKEALLLQTFKDPSPKVQRLAVDAVHRGASVPPEAQIVDIALNHGTLDSLSRALSIFTHCGTWTRLQWMLVALRSTLSAGGEELCLRELAQWQTDARRNFVAPTALQRAGIAGQWVALSPMLSPELRNKLAFVLRTHGVLGK